MPGSPLPLLMSLVPRLITTTCGSTWKSQRRPARFVTVRVVEHRHRAARVAAVVADDAAARRRDRADLGAERARRDRPVGVPVALGREALAVGERCRGCRSRSVIESPITSMRRPAPAGGSISAPSPTVEPHQPRLALRPLRLAVELDRVRRRRPGRRRAGTSPVPAAAVNGACGAPSITALKICAEPVMRELRGQRRPGEARHEPAARPGEARAARAFDVVSTRPNQRTPAATTPAGGGDGLLPPASTGGAWRRRRRRRVARRSSDRWRSLRAPRAPRQRRSSSLRHAWSHGVTAPASAIPRPARSRSSRAHPTTAARRSATACRRRR